MSKQQTAVQWLINQLYEKHGLFIPIPQFDSVKESVDAALKMEKGQKIGLLKWMNDVAKDTPMRLETDHDDIVEQYYNETYGTENSD